MLRDTAKDGDYYLAVYTFVHVLLQYTQSSVHIDMYYIYRIDHRSANISYTKGVIILRTHRINTQNLIQIRC